MANRKRPIVLRCPVTAEERALIEQKMAQLPTQRIGAYLARWRLTDISSTPTQRISSVHRGAVCHRPQYQPDCKEAQLRRSRVSADMDEIRERLDQIWQLQRRILSNQH